MSTNKKTNNSVAENAKDLVASVIEEAYAKELVATMINEAIDQESTAEETPAVAKTQKPRQTKEEKELAKKARQEAKQAKELAKQAWQATKKARKEAKQEVLKTKQEMQQVQNQAVAEKKAFREQAQAITKTIQKGVKLVSNRSVLARKACISLRQELPLRILAHLDLVNKPIEQYLDGYKAKTTIVESSTSQVAGLLQAIEECKKVIDSKIAEMATLQAEVEKVLGAEKPPNTPTETETPVATAEKPQVLFDTLPDPYLVYREGPEKLDELLDSLDVFGLKKLIKENRLDVAHRFCGSLKREKLVEGIKNQVITRESTKDVFRNYQKPVFEEAIAQRNATLDTLNNCSTDEECQEILASLDFEQLKLIATYLKIPVRTSGTNITTQAELLPLVADMYKEIEIAPSEKVSEENPDNTNLL